MCVNHLIRSWQREVLSVHQNDPCTEIFCRGEGRKKEEEEEEKEEEEKKEEKKEEKEESGFQKSRFQQNNKQQ